MKHVYALKFKHAVNTKLTHTSIIHACIHMNLSCIVIRNIQHLLHIL